MLDQNSKHLHGSSPQPQNLTLLLKQKKKQIIQQQQMMNQKIKSYFAQLTIQIQDKQSCTLKSLQDKMYLLYESIDQYCGMTENQRTACFAQIWQLIDRKFEFVENKKFNELLQTDFIQVCYANGRNDTEFDVNSSNMSFQQQKTSKKGKQKQYTVLKGTYLQQIQQLQEKISKLLLKQDKLKTKLTEMESKLKMKKIGNTYLPYEQKPISNLLLQRLQSQNKILIQQIADSSVKILSLRSQNSLLIKQRQNSQILTATDKKRYGESIHVIEQSVQFSQYQEKINVLQMEIQKLHHILEQEKQIMMINYSQLQKQKKEVAEQYEKRLREQSNYLKRMHEKQQEEDKIRTQLQKRISQLKTSLQEQREKTRIITKEHESSKQMNNNYGKLLKLKDDKISEHEMEIVKYEQKQKQNQNKYKAMYVQLNQKLQNKQNTIKMKMMEIDSYKSAIKKEQSEKNQYKTVLAKKQQELYTIQQTIKSLETQLTKLSKDKETNNKKQANKIKKQMKKLHEDEKGAILEEFKVKYGDLMDKIQLIKKESLDNKEKYDKKFKLYEARLQNFKDKTAFQMKEMMEKLGKPGQKQKLISVIESYIQNQATITLKNSQIKALKQEIATLKKPNAKKQTMKPTGQAELWQQLQQFEKKLFIEKMEIQQTMYETKIKSQQEQYQSKLQQKMTIIQNITSKCNNLQKNIKQVKNQLALVNSSSNPELLQLKKTKDQWSQRQQRMQSLINSLKNNLNKVQNEAQQTREELKLKKDIILGLKKQIKQKQTEKIKLNEVINSLMEEGERMKKTKIEANKKQAIFSEFKDKLISQSELSQEICQLRTNLEEKQKQYKLELNKKQQIIKELKANQEIANKKVKNQSILQDQIVDLKQKIKKNKIQIERKDTLIEHLKEKQQKTSSQLVAATETSEAQFKKCKKQLENQKLKNQGMRLKIGKLQTNCQLLKLSLTRVYEDMCQKITPSCTTIQKDYTSFKSDTKKTRFEFTVEKTPQITDMNKYKQALSILQLSSQDFEQGNFKNTDIYSPIPHKMYQSVAAHDRVKLSKLLENEDIDSKAIVQVFTLVLQS